MSQREGEVELTRYAVLEWEDDSTDELDVIATDQSLSTAQLLVNIAPGHLHREFITMTELSKYQ
ncbi:hypothetical protein D3C81_1969880 [compost metagenome]